MDEAFGPKLRHRVGHRPEIIDQRELLDAQLL
jgi:hypothetical protein